MVIELIKFNFILFLLTLIVIICVPLVRGQFRGLFADLTVPDCLQSNGRRGKCYLYSECGQFYKKTSNFDVCEFSLDQRFLTVCCDELPSTRYNIYRAEDNWVSSSGLVSSSGPMVIDFECGVRIANKDILEVVSSTEGDSNDQGQLFLQALTYLAARDGTHPWMASIWYKNSPICGASIINRRALLTSAHCFKFSR